MRSATSASGKAGSSPSAEGDLVGAEVVEAGGLVVAPGFIDLHAHGQDAVSSEYQAMDGVTTALELEIGAFPVARWYARRDGAGRIHYGASVSHQGAGIRAMRSPFALSNADGTFSLGNSTDDALYRAATDEERGELGRLMEQGLRDGGIGFGFGLSYTPGASHRELLELFDLATRYAAPSFIHLRSASAFARGALWLLSRRSSPTPRSPAPRSTSCTSTAPRGRARKRRWQ